MPQGVLCVCVCVCVGVCVGMRTRRAVGETAGEGAGAASIGIPPAECDSGLNAHRLCRAILAFLFELPV